MKINGFFSRRGFLTSVPGLTLLAGIVGAGKLRAGKFEEKNFQDRMIDRFPDFKDGRSKKVMFVSHCVINQNARCSSCNQSAAYIPLVPHYLLEHDIGIAQIPCPELGCLGLGRGGQIYDQLSTPASRRYLKNLARDIVYQIGQYQKHGFNVMGVLGINCSPSCGVDCHAYNGPKPGKGAFMEELTEELARENIDIPLIGVADENPEKAVRAIEALNG